MYIVDMREIYIGLIVLASGLTGALFMCGLILAFVYLGDSENACHDALSAFIGL